MSLNLFRGLMPAEEAFTPLFCQQADLILRAAHALRQMIAEHVAAEQHVAAIRDIELAGDAVARQIFISANRTFNAPIDREDILALAHLLDDCLDLIEDTAKGIQRYDVRETPAEMQAMGDAVVEAAGILQKVMPFLDSVTKDYKAIAALCEQVGQIEGRRRIIRPWPHASASAATARRSRHDRLHRPQRALRAHRGRGRQV